MRKFLHNLQPSSGGKENLVGSGRTPQDLTIEGKTVKLEQEFTEVEVNIKDVNETAPVENINESLYKKLLTEDLTSTAGPSENYWEVIAERRRVALEDSLQENQRLIHLITTLEDENMTCKQLLEDTTDLINTLKEMISESQYSGSDDNDEPSNDQGDSGLSTPDSFSSGNHVHKKMKNSKL
jgi:geminin